MKRAVLIFFITLLFIACGPSQQNKKSRLAQDTYIEMITDILILNQVYVQHPKTQDSLQVDFMQSIYNKYHTDSMQFYATMEYYARHPDEFLEVYQKVEKRLKFKMDSLDKTLKTSMPDKKKKLPVDIKAFKKQ